MTGKESGRSKEKESMQELSHRCMAFTRSLLRLRGARPTRRKKLAVGVDRDNGKDIRGAQVLCHKALRDGLASHSV